MSDVIVQLRRFRAPISVAFDSGCWVFAYFAFAWLRFDAEASHVPWMEVGAVALGNAVLYVLLAKLVRLHEGRAKVGSLEEMLLLGSVMAGSGLTVFVVNLATQWVPRSIPAGATMLALVLAAWARASWRRFGEMDAHKLADDDDATRVLVVGAGEAGRQLVGSMLGDPRGQWRPVALLDDDPQKRHRRVRRVPVLGTTAPARREGQGARREDRRPRAAERLLEGHQAAPARGHGRRPRGQGAAGDHAAAA